MLPSFGPVNFPASRLGSRSQDHACIINVHASRPWILCLLLSGSISILSLVENDQAPSTCLPSFLPSFLPSAYEQEGMGPHRQAVYCMVSKKMHHLDCQERKSGCM
mmetsp:Transcript_49692/g.97929  ORF Transcript_49692/g.97929 Transcript_49692/m.97929 type:complete len:106 (+) Transcript_49692:133-450(+)